MRNLLSNKYVILGIALITGAVIGYFIRPSAPQTMHEQEHSQSHATMGQIWTCSMHPQIRMHEPGQCPLCGMDLTPLPPDRPTENRDPMVIEMSPEAVAMARVQTFTVKSANSDAEVYLSGEVAADEQRLVSLTAKYPGRIERLFVNFTGQIIQQGERIATIYSPELLTAQNELLESLQSKESFPALYEAAREKLRLWKLTEGQIQEIESTGKVREQFDLLADKGGVVIQKNISEGDYVGTGSVLFGLADLSHVWIMLDAYVRDLPYLNIGDEVTFTVAGVSGKTFTSKINYIDPVINTATSTASIRAEIHNPNGLFKPGMYINAIVRVSPASAQPTTVAIPKSALLWTGKRSIVYVKAPDGDFPAYEMREVTIGSGTGEMYMVEEGLELGEEVVTNGVFAVDASAQLAGNYSMMNKPETLPDTLQAHISELADAYFSIKNFLVNSDLSSGKKASHHMKSLLSQRDMQLHDRSYDQWMAYKMQISDALKKMEMAKDLEAVRQHFSQLSNIMLEIAETFGLENEKIYWNYCPMAFDNKGANWLSETEEIRNPYFGDAMHSCGEIKPIYLKE